jgi:hypothetical protein
MRKDFIRTTRQHWAEKTNADLNRAGTTQNIDHRSLADQAGAAIEEGREALVAGDETTAAGHLDRAEKLMRPPQTHLGPVVYNMERRAIETAKRNGVPY